MTVGAIAALALVQVPGAFFFDRNRIAFVALGYGDGWNVVPPGAMQTLFQEVEQAVGQMGWQIDATGPLHAHPLELFGELDLELSRYQRSEFDFRDKQGRFTKGEARRIAVEGCVEVGFFQRLIAVEICHQRFGGVVERGQVRIR